LSRKFLIVAIFTRIAVRINEKKGKKMSTMLCNVSGIDNKETKAKIKNELDKIDGVQKVSVAQVTGTIKVDYSEPATKNLIKNCIENTGFKIEYE
jgi:copper chaperone CopZ